MGGDQAQRWLCDAWADTSAPSALVDGNEHDALMDQALQFVESFLAALRVELAHLLVKQVVKVRVLLYANSPHDTT